MYDDPTTLLRFKNAANDCRKQLDYALDIYREVIVAFESDNWQAKGPEMAMSNAEKAGVIDSLQHKRLSETWQETIQEATGKKADVTTFGHLQEKLENKIFAMSFNCALNAVKELELKS